MVEGSIVGPVRPPGRGQERSACLRETETAEGLGGGAGHWRRVVDDKFSQRLKRRGVAVEAHDMAGRLADAGVGIDKAGTSGPAGFIAVDPGECPESLLTDGGGSRCREHVTDRRHRGGTYLCEGIGGPGDDGGAQVGQQRSEARRGHPLPIETFTARIGNRRRPLAPNPIDRAEDRRLLEL